MCFGEHFGTGSLFEAEFGETFFLEADIFQQDASKAPIFEKNGEEEVFWLNRGVAGIEGDFPSFFQAVPSVEGQFLVEGRFEHRQDWSRVECPYSRIFSSLLSNGVYLFQFSFLLLKKW